MLLDRTKEVYALLEDGTVFAEPAYLYEFRTKGSYQPRHGIIVTTILNMLKQKGYDVDVAPIYQGFSFHNLKVVSMGPYILNSYGNVVYTFNVNNIMNKLDYGTGHPEKHLFVPLARGVYKSVSMDGDKLRSAEILASLPNGVIHFNVSQNSLFINIMATKNFMTDEIKQQILFKDVEQGSKTIPVNNPAIGIKALLNLLLEDEENGTRAGD